MVFSVTSLFSNNIQETSNTQHTSRKTEKSCAAAFQSLFTEHTHSVITAGLVWFILLAGFTGMTNTQLAIAVPFAAIWTTAHASTLFLALAGGATAFACAKTFFSWWQGGANGGGSTPTETVTTAVLNATTSAVKQKATTAATGAAAVAAGTIGQKIQEAVQPSSKPAIANPITTQTPQGVNSSAGGTPTPLSSISSPLGMPHLPNILPSNLPPSPIEILKSMPEAQLQQFHNIYSSVAQSPGFDIQNSVSREILAKQCRLSGLNWAETFLRKEAPSEGFSWGQAAKWTGGALVIAGLAYGGWKIYEHYSKEDKKDLMLNPEQVREKLIAEWIKRLQNLSPEQQKELQTQMSKATTLEEKKKTKQATQVPQRVKDLESHLGFETPQSTSPSKLPITSQTRTFSHLMGHDFLK